MTVQQIAEWVEAFNASILARTKEKIQILDGQAKQIISGVGSMLDKKVKFLTLEKLYPDWFDDKKSTDTSNLSPEEIGRKQAGAWFKFLGL